MKKTALLTLSLGSAALVSSAALIRDRRIWTGELQRVRRQLQLQRPDTPGERFHAGMIEDLPEVARTYLLHAIAPGTLLAQAVELTMSGTMRLAPDGAWLPMQAQQLLAPPHGFLWQATVGRGLARFSGADYYLDGAGRMNFRLGGIVPVARASGPDTARSARGRLAGEAIWNPAALLPQRGTTWTPIDAQSARATLAVDGERIPVTVTVEPNGRLRSVSLLRWGDRTADGRFDAIPFGMAATAEATFDGYTIPVAGRGGWWFGTDRFFDFFHPVITSAHFVASAPGERSGSAHSPER